MPRAGQNFKLRHYQIVRPQARCNEAERDVTRHSETSRRYERRPRYKERGATTLRSWHLLLVGSAVRRMTRG